LEVGLWQVVRVEPWGGVGACIEGNFLVPSIMEDPPGSRSSPDTNSANTLKMNISSGAEKYRPPCLWHFLLQQPELTKALTRTVRKNHSLKDSNAVPPTAWKVACLIRRLLLCQSNLLSKYT
jgi:hypothetical protein